MKRLCTDCDGTGYIFDPEPRLDVGGIEPERDTLNCRRVLRIVREWEGATGFDLVEIAGPSRWKYRVMLRDSLIRRLHNETNLTLEAIGTIFGGRDHSTVCASLKRTAQRTNGVTA
jgi:Bacterial dnaA protein helix-turn-helix